MKRQEQSLEDSSVLVSFNIALYLDDVSAAPITGYLPVPVQLRRFGNEMMGGFVMSFMVQLISEKNMTYIEHNR